MGELWGKCWLYGPNPTDRAVLQLIEQYMLNEQPPDDGHRVNLLNTSYHHLGVGIYIDSTGIIWVTDLYNCSDNNARNLISSNFEHYYHYSYLPFYTQVLLSISVLAIC